MYCRYEPLFNYFMEFSDVAFRVVADNYVTDDSGTGVVHCAPAFGEDDYRVCTENQIISKVCTWMSLAKKSNFSAMSCSIFLQCEFCCLVILLHVSSLGSRCSLSLESLAKVVVLPLYFSAFFGKFPK